MNSFDELKFRQLLTLLLSIAAHLFLVIFIGNQIVTIRTVTTENPASHPAINIRLIERNPAENTNISTASHSESRPTKLIEPPPVVAATPETPALFEIIVPPKPYYFRTTELSEKPRVLIDLPPDLALTLGNATQKSAILRLQINEIGEIDQVLVDESKFSEAEKKLLIDAFSKMKFEPGLLDDIPVKSEMKIEILIEKIAPIAYPK